MYEVLLSKPNAQQRGVLLCIPLTPVGERTKSDKPCQCQQRKHHSRLLSVGRSILQLVWIMPGGTPSTHPTTPLNDTRQNLETPERPLATVKNQGSPEPLPLPSDAVEADKTRALGDRKGSTALAPAVGERSATQSPPDTVWWATKT